ncbi:DUF305 domain-containing protein [Sphingomicrobium clamense]|uniref:DUF305 domain-containing protein n=1 Tax=Sphingomicrobium clamense TaxID=2851013 RepID=A0ABS6V713_9SPHN|nr:DUF305 domain-containing protein [Sphingomicrobium sp. B8]MBW0145354.1 DUF305 domain-containing protein [Sphingomicrobium sp. B8]
MNIRLATIFLAGSALAAPAFAQDVPIVLPGAPGEPSRTIDASQASDVVRANYSVGDVKFMHAMIPHHQQAVVMAQLVDERTSDPTIRATAERILLAQKDEMDFMRGWLAARGEPTAAEGMHAIHLGMKGMASEEELAKLAASRASDFDRLFLRLMIDHHAGAIDMVRGLMEQSGTAYDPALYAFTQEVVIDQSAEIKRMVEALGKLTTDPRSSLKPGFRDAGEAIMGLTKIASLPRAPGFFDPENPGDLQPVQAGEDATDRRGETQYVPRSSPMNFWNSDMAFADGKLFVGSFHGYNIYDLDDAGVPTLMTSVVCPGGQGDVSIVGDLLIMSVESNAGRIDCGLQGNAERISDERFRGVRIFDISDLTAPKQVGQVQTCRGSHTHSVVSDGSEDGMILVYNSGAAGVRPEEELPGCVIGLPGDPDTSYFSIDIIEIPIADPSKSRVLSSPRIFADLETGAPAGLWRGGDHGDDTQDTSVTNHCHDITAFPDKDIAGGACSGNGILLDISDRRAPKRLDAVVDPGFAYWHSATFNNDGTKVIFTDEWGGGTRPRCRPQDPKNWGANAIYRIEGSELKHQGGYKLRAAQDELQNCVAHNGSIVPVPGRDIFAQAWYQGGMSISDFTDEGDAVEIAYFDRGPLDGKQMVGGGYWSTYWYDGAIYASAMVRGLDVFKLAPSEMMSANEIAAAEMAIMGDIVNPQNQFAVSWPDHPVIGKAYVDQLLRSNAIDAATHIAMIEALNSAIAPIETGSSDAAAAARLVAAARDLPEGSGADAKRVAALSALMSRMARTLR